MGCIASRPSDGAGGKRRRPRNLGEVAVFIPGLRVPKFVDFTQPLGDSLPRSLIERLAALRSRVVVLTAQEAPRATKPKRRSATQHGGSSLADLLQALEDYLPVLLGLVEEGSHLEDKVSFTWMNQSDCSEETAMGNARYEVLSVVHLMAMIYLSEANSLLLAKLSTDGYQPRFHEGSKKASIEIFLKAAGYLDCAIQHVLPQIPPDLRKDLPVDLAEGVLKALCMQALGQCVDVQLGMAIDCPNATLAVKRRLACEMVKYWHQAWENVSKLSLTEGWGQKHRLFVQWKYVEAKAAAYYYHGLILNEGSTDKHSMSLAALQAAEEFLKESKRASEAFNTALPSSRNPPLWGSMKYLSDMIPKDASNKVHVHQDLRSHHRILESAPTLPDFVLALKPDDYVLPQLDSSWNKGDYHQLKSSKNTMDNF